MNFLLLKQAQCAMADGRLDEAHQLLRNDALRAHRHGQRLVTRLIQALTARGRTHLQAGRLSDALADCTKAGELGGSDHDVAELRRQVIEQLETQRRQSEQRARALSTARKHAREGFLSQGAALLRNVPDDTGCIAEAQREFDLQRARIDAALQRGQSALDSQDWSAATHHLTEARRLRPFDPRLESLLHRLTDEATAEAKQAAESGRIDTASTLLQAIAPAVGDRLPVCELRQTLDQITQARTALRDGDARAAGRELRKVKLLLFPGARAGTAWIDEAIDHCDRMAASRDALEVGPLGLCHTTATTWPPIRSAAPAIAYHEKVTQHFPEGGSVLPARFILQADGQSAAMIVRDEVVMLGPISSAQRPDVGLLADPSAPTITIRRTQDDYFLHSTEPVKINHQPASDHLLTDGDKIELSPRCRLRFRLPHAASTTAVLELTGSRLPRGDVRRIVLLDRQLVVGPGPSCHVRADGAHQPVILHLRGGQLHPLDAANAATFSLNQPITLGDLTLRLTEV